jgi:hypothetical protein
VQAELRAAGFHEFEGSNYLCHTMKEIQASLVAARMRSNDLSVTAAIGCLLFMQSNSDPEKGEPITDYSIFLPFPTEYKNQIEENSSDFVVTQATAKAVLACYDLFNSRSIGLISTHIDDIRRAAKG